MKKRLLVQLAAMGLAVSGLIGLSATPASAHLYDTYAAFYCGASRIDSSFILLHATPDHLQPEYVRYYCRATNGGDDVQWWVIRWWNGEWSMASGYQDCDLVNCHEP